MANKPFFFRIAYAFFFFFFEDNNYTKIDIFIDFLQRGQTVPSSNFQLLVPNYFKAVRNRRNVKTSV